MALSSIVSGVAGAQTLSVPAVGVFVDESGEERSFGRTYLEWFGEAERQPKPFRAVLEIAGVMALGVGHYWTQRHANKADWDEPSPVDRITLRALRFDNNLFSTNNVLHPLAGMAYYGLPRVNGFNPLEALLAVTAASTFWEFALEWREKISINDMIVTPIGGMAIGEFLYQLGHYVTSTPARGGPAQEVAAWTLGFPQRVHDVIDRTKARPDLPLDRLGFSTAFWHRFRLVAGAAEHSCELDRGQASEHLVAAGEIIAVPGFLRPGRFRLLFSEGNWARFRVRMELVGDDLRDFDLWAETALAGFYAQDVSLTRQGQGILFALGAAVRDSDSSLLGRRDQLAVAHLAEALSRLWLVSGDAIVRLEAAFGVDFASVRSLALASWAASQGMDGIKTVLSKQGYYFSVGYSMRLAAELEYRRVEVGGHLSYGDYESVEGFDRLQALVVRDIGAEDEVMEYGAWLELGLGTTPLRANISYDEILRWSRLERQRESRWTRRVAASLALVF